MGQRAFRFKHPIRPSLRNGIVSCLLAAGLTAAAPAGAAPSADDAYVNGLIGHWAMTGTLRGKPVRYVAEGRRVLKSGFLELHMSEGAAPTQYEADLFLGYDPKHHDYVAHWLDRFGAAGARVVATGTRKDNELVLVFPYAEGAFRDTFTWHKSSNSWSLLLEDQSADGSWSKFAEYTITRVHK